MVRRGFIFIGLMVIFAFGLAGCAATRVERDFGNSLRQAKSNQILNKDTGKNLEPVTGLDGQSASVIMEEYRKGFTTEGKKAETPGLLDDEESKE